MNSQPHNEDDQHMKIYTEDIKINKKISYILRFLSFSSVYSIEILIVFLYCCEISVMKKHYRDMAAKER